MEPRYTTPNPSPNPNPNPNPSLMEPRYTSAEWAQRAALDTLRTSAAALEGEVARPLGSPALPRASVAGSALPGSTIYISAVICSLAVLCLLRVLLKSGRH